MSAAQPFEETDADVIDGWVVEDAEVYHYLTDRDPPRPACHLLMLRLDARHREVRRVWLSTAALLAAGVAAIAAGFLLDELWQAAALAAGGAVWLTGGGLRTAAYL